MADTVFIPPDRRPSRGIFIPPLLVIPFVLYNIIAIVSGMNPAVWNTQAFPIPMVSGASWYITWGDLMLVLGLVCLFLEVLKSTNTGRSSVVEHMLSTILFIVFLIEFLLVGYSASSVFFLLMMMSIFDLVAGFTVSITSAGRDVSMN
ncbi:MAG TPA: hypothetical protein PK286_13805 [Devosia sp.]|nr:hypothetical protein [Devosia sp.]